MVVLIQYLYQISQRKLYQSLGSRKYNDESIKFHLPDNKKT